MSDGTSTIVSGQISVTSNPAQEKVQTSFLPQDDDAEEVMSSKDIYKELRLRGYQYEGAFRALKSASISGKKGHTAWTGNWVTFLDSILQLMVLGTDTRDLYVPMRIQRIVIDTKLHQQEVQNMDLEDKR